MNAKVNNRSEIVVLLLFIWFSLVITFYGRRNLLDLDQFGFSNIQGVPADAWITEIREFQYAWTRRGLAPPQSLDDFYKGGYAEPSGLGAVNIPRSKHFFMSIFFWIFNGNAKMAQHVFVSSLIIVSGVSMYLLLCKFKIRYIARFMGAFIYMINPQIIIAAIGNAPFYPVYALQPLIILFSLRFLDHKEFEWRNLLSVIILVGLASAFLWFLIPIMFVFFLTVAYILSNFEKKVLLRSFLLFSSVLAMAILLELSYLFPIMTLLFEGKPLTSIYTTISAKYDIAGLISGISYNFNIENINLLRLITNNTDTIPYWWYGGTHLWNVFGFSLIIFSMFSLLIYRSRDRNTKYTLLFSTVALLSISWIWLTKHGITTPVYATFPVLFIFNTSEWFNWVTVAAYGVLIALTADKMLEIIENGLDISRKFNLNPKRLRSIHVKRGAAAVLLISLWSSILIYNWPIFSGDMGLSQMPYGFMFNNYEPFMSSVYYQMHDWLMSNNPDPWNLRVMILPYGPNTHYYRLVVAPNVFIPPGGLMEIFFTNSTWHFGSLLGFFNVKYVFLNLESPSLGTPFAHRPEVYISILNSQKDMRLIHSATDFLVYENEQFAPIVSLYSHAIYLEVENSSSLSLPDRIRLLSIMPGFNMYDQLLFFGNEFTGSEAKWAKNVSRVWLYFEKPLNESLSEEYYAPEERDILYVLGSNSFKGSKVSSILLQSKIHQNGSFIWWEPSAYVKIPESPSLDKEFNAMTMSVWIYPLSYGWGSAGALISNEAPSIGGSFQWSDRWYTPVEFVPDWGSTLPNPELNKWTFLAVVFNGTHLMSFMDGELNAIAPSTASSFRLEGTTYIGSYLGNHSFFNGYLANFQIYDSALDSTKIKRLYDGGLLSLPIESDNIVGWWFFNQTTLGSTAIDLSQSNNHGILVGDFKWEFVNPFFARERASASFGQVLKIEQLTGEVKANLYVRREGLYDVALHGAVMGRIYINGNSTKSENHTDVDLKWYFTKISLNQGENEIKISTDGSTEIDALVIYSSSNRTLEEIFNPRRMSDKPSYSARQIGYSRYYVEADISNPSFLTLWETFDKGWTAYGKTESSLRPFIAGSWANGFYSSESGRLGIDLYYAPQNFRDIVIAIWVTIYGSLIMAVILLSREDILKVLRPVTEHIMDFASSK